MVNHKTYNEDKNPTNHISNSNKYKSKTKQIWRRAMSHKTYDEDKNPKRHISKNKYKLKDRQIPRRAQNNKKTMKRRILRFLELLDIFFTRIMNIIICISFITPFIIAKVTKRIEDLVTISKSNIIFIIFYP